MFNLLARLYIWFAYKKIAKSKCCAEKDQEKILQTLMHKARNTLFGKAHHFKNIKTYQDFQNLVPIRDYEGFSAYIQEIKNGVENVLWQGKPLYFAKTSGTTSGAKYIPISKESINNHINGAKWALISYLAHTKKYDFLKGKMMFLQGSPILEEEKGIKIGRLSGIVAHHVPFYLQNNRMPSWKVNCMADWEEKVNAIAKETASQNMTLISGIPIWVQMYFEKVLQIAGAKNIKQVFPNFSLFIYGGVQYAPYKKRMQELIGEEIDSLELYPASEGFIAFQEKPADKDLLLLTNAGIFYEFLPVQALSEEKPKRLRLSEVQLDEAYAIVINSNAGLWGYLLGDTVKFTSVKPYKIQVTGRVSHYISAFGEHVIAKEVEDAMAETLQTQDAFVQEFTVMPEVAPLHGLPYHEWFVEFAKKPKDLAIFAKTLDENLQKRNIYYKDLIQGNILQTLKITCLEKQAFENAMKEQGKLDAQNKVPRLGNDRKFAQLLTKYTLRP